VFDFRYALGQRRYLGRETANLAIDLLEFD
jgi:hypothetical protein